MKKGRKKGLSLGVKAPWRRRGAVAGGTRRAGGRRAHGQPARSRPPAIAPGSRAEGLPAAAEASERSAPSERPAKTHAVASPTRISGFLTSSLTEKIMCISFSDLMWL